MNILNVPIVVGPMVIIWWWMTTQANVYLYAKVAWEDMGMLGRAFSSRGLFYQVLIIFAVAAGANDLENSLVLPAGIGFAILYTMLLRVYIEYKVEQICR